LGLFEVDTLKHFLEKWACSREDQRVAFELLQNKEHIEIAEKCGLTFSNLAARLSAIVADFEETVVQIPRLEEMQQIFVPVFAQHLLFWFCRRTHLYLVSKTNIC
jgi:hypothetical protein